MQQTSALYNEILATAGHWFETKLVINETLTINESDGLFSVNTSTSAFDASPEIGKAVSQDMDAVLLSPSADIPDMATVQPYVRVCDDTRQSEWLPQGVFFTDTRDTTRNNDGLDVLTIHGYDAMLKAEQIFQSATITGDSTDTDMVDAIASIMGVDVDSRTYTLMDKAYTIPLPTGYTCREVLGYIASMYVGFFIITEEGKLRLVSILGLPPETNYLVDGSFDTITFGGDRILV